MMRPHGEKPGEIYFFVYSSGAVSGQHFHLCLDTCSFSEPVHIMDSRSLLLIAMLYSF